MHTNRNIIAAVALAALWNAGSVFAQAQQPIAAPEPRPAEQTRPPEAPTAFPAPIMVEGELVKVDPTAKMITIRNTKEQELQFNYTDVTIVTGTDAKVAGLATMAGTPVTVHYTKIELPGEPVANVASRIEVRKK